MDGFAHGQVKSTQIKFYLSTLFLSKNRLKLAKNQANSEQHFEVELFLLENYSLASAMLSSKIIGHIPKNKQKNKSQVSFDYD